MFCKNCGTQNGDVPFCANCGAPLAAPAAPAAPAYTAPAAPAAPAYTAPAAPAYAAPGAPAAPAAPAGKAGRGIPVIGIAAAAVAVVVVLIILLCSGGAKAKALRFVKLQSKGEFVKAEKLIHKKVKEELKLDKKSYLNDLEDMSEDFNDEKEDFVDENGKIRYSYKVKDVDNVEKQAPDYYDEIVDRYEEEYDLKVKAAKWVEVEVRATCDGQETDIDMTILMVKAGGKWTVADSYAGGNSFYSFAPEID